MAHHFEGPKDKTNPLAYFPIAVIAIAVVASVFASGYQRGAFKGRITEKSEDAIAKKPAKVYNVQLLAKDPSSETIADGRRLYALNCASCHGEEGKGNGALGKGLNPPPRDFHSSPSEWKNGSSILGRWKTLQEGVQGSSMASYASMLNARERMAIIHYMEPWLVDAPEMTPEMIAELPAGSSSSDGGEITPPPDPGPRVPIEYAMSVLAVDDPASVEPTGYHPPSDSAGASLYAGACASCHGAAGEGADSTVVLTTYPFVRLSGPAIAGAKNAWVTDEVTFSELLTTTLPGGAATHGFGDLSSGEVHDLHQFAATLARQGN